VVEEWVPVDLWNWVLFDARLGLSSKKEMEIEVKISQRDHKSFNTYPSV
jgi:hypothetical protein